MLILTIADSLRYDYTEKYMKDVFKESTLTKVISSGTYTAITIPTIVTGQPPEKHKKFDWLDKIHYDRCLFDYFDKYETISFLMGTGPLKMTVDTFKLNEQNLKMFFPIDFNVVSNNEHDVFVSMSKDLDLVFYHSFLTHYPYGLPNVHCGGYFTPKEYQNQLRLMRRPRIIEMYKWGVIEMRERMKAIETITKGKDLIIMTADHGEFLKEEPNLITHGPQRPKRKEILEVPLLINRKVDLPDVIKQEDLLDIILDLSREEGIIKKV